MKIITHEAEAAEKMHLSLEEYNRRKKLAQQKIIHVFQELGLIDIDFSEEEIQILLKKMKYQP